MQDQIEELLTERRFDITIAPQLEAYVDEQVRRTSSRSRINA